MEYLTSRKNPVITEFRALAASGSRRRERQLYVLDGRKLLREALASGAEIAAALWCGEADIELGPAVKQYAVPRELMDYASPLVNCPGPIFAVRMREDSGAPVDRALVLEGVQDPGNVGTVIRTAAAFGIEAVVLTGPCADPYSPKAARAAMGALLRQRVLRVEPEELASFLTDNSLVLYGAVPGEGAQDIRDSFPQNRAVAVGSEGQGLSEELLALCSGRLTIPMAPGSESLNAAVAAAVIMWEMCR